MRKIILYMRLNILYMFRNKVRFSLTVLGISIGLLIYILGNSGADAYLNSLYEKAYNFADNSYLITDDKNVLLPQIQAEQEQISINKCNFIGSVYKLNKSYTYKKIEISNSMGLFGVDSALEDSIIPYKYENSISLAKSKIIYGHDFTEHDISTGANVIIIEKSTAQFLFQKDNAVGESIDYVTEYGYTRFEVIGIIEDLPCTKANNLKFNNIVDNSINKEYKNISSGYISYNCMSKLVDDLSIQIRYIIRDNNSNHLTFKEFMDSINNNIKAYSLEAKIDSRDSIIKRIRIEENALKGFINIILFIIILISGFMIMTIYIFSVKERMYEIGVKRAIGGSKFEILKQFILEGIITSIFAGIITIFMSAIICNLGTAYLIGKLYVNIRLVLSREIIISTMGLSILQGVIFCLIPSWIASKIRPSEALRLD